jgi:hypothetical protein
LSRDDTTNTLSVYHRFGVAPVLPAHLRSRGAVESPVGGPHEINIARGEAAYRADAIVWRHQAWGLASKRANLARLKEAANDAGLKSSVDAAVAA